MASGTRGRALGGRLDVTGVGAGDMQLRSLNVGEIWLLTYPAVTHPMAPAKTNQVKELTLVSRRH